jgi:hypothetical protein
MRPESDRDRIIIDPPRSEYLWCLHCERTYERWKWRTIDGFQIKNSLRGILKREVFP